MRDIPERYRLPDDEVERVGVREEIDYRVATPFKNAHKARRDWVDLIIDLLKIYFHSNNSLKLHICKTTDARMVEDDRTPIEADYMYR